MRWSDPRLPLSLNILDFSGKPFTTSASESEHYMVEMLINTTSRTPEKDRPDISGVREMSRGKISLKLF